MSYDGDEEDFDDDEYGRDGPVQRPRGLLERFRRGNRWVALACGGIFVGVVLAAGAADGFIAHKHVPKSPHVRWLLAFAAAAWLVCVIFMPNKRLALLRNPLGYVPMEGWRDWLFPAAVAAAAFAVAYASTWL